jgi:hypothetical protein
VIQIESLPLASRRSAWVGDERALAVMAGWLWVKSRCGRVGKAGTGINTVAGFAFQSLYFPKSEDLAGFLFVTLW